LIRLFRDYPGYLLCALVVCGIVIVIIGALIKDRMVERSATECAERGGKQIEGRYGSRLCIDRGVLK